METKVLVIGMYETIGGIESFLLNYLKYIDKSQLKLYYLCMYEKFYFSSEIEKYGGEIIKISHVKEKPIKYFRELNNIIRTYKIDVVHINMLSAANIVPLIACKYSGVKRIIVHSHNSNVPNNKIKQVLHIINRKLIPFLATDFWGCSKEAGKWLYGERLPKNKKIEVINNAIEVENYAFNLLKREQYKKQFDLDGKVIFGHVGAFREQKNQIRLITIFSEVTKIVENAVLVFVGEAIRPDEKKYLNDVKEKIEELSLQNNVLFLGNRNDVGNLMSLFDVMIFPSKFEGLPLVLVESQAAALPTVISKDVIPAHVKMTEYIEFESLSSSDKEWAKKAVELLGKERNINVYDVLKEAGYNVKVEANRLMQMYKK